MQIKSSVKNDSLFILLDGELVESTVEYTRDKLDEVMAQTKAEKIVLNLADLRFMDSTGIGVLIGRYKKMKVRNIPIYILNPSDQAERIFYMTGLYTLMPRFQEET